VPEAVFAKLAVLPRSSKIEFITVGALLELVIGPGRRSSHSAISDHNNRKIDKQLGESDVASFRADHHYNRCKHTDLGVCGGRFSGPEC
jgi:hypothetical protein